MNLYPETRAHDVELPVKPNAPTWWQSRQLLEVESDVEDLALQA